MALHRLQTRPSTPTNGLSLDSKPLATLPGLHRTVVQQSVYPLSTRIEVQLCRFRRKPLPCPLRNFKSCTTGIEQKLDPGDPSDRNVYEMTEKELKEIAVGMLPTDLDHALIALDNDPVIQEVLGEHSYANFRLVKQKEWDSYRITVHPWEIDRHRKMF